MSSFAMHIHQLAPGFVFFNKIYGRLHELQARFIVIKCRKVQLFDTQGGVLCSGPWVFVAHINHSSDTQIIQCGGVAQNIHGRAAQNQSVV